VTTGAASTIGWFTAEPGTTSVTCTYDRAAPAGRDIGIGPGKPSSSIGDLALLAGGITALIAGGALLARAWRPKVISTIPGP
jgi:hypothetical protein